MPEHACAAETEPEGENALDVARRAFGFLVTGPHPIALNGCALPEWPARLVPLDEVTARVLHRQCPQPVRDHVWTELVTRARAEGGAWTLGCVGVALPALTTIAARLTARFAADPADIHAAVLAGFLAALAEIDLRGPRIMNRLRWAAYRSGHAALRDALDAPEPGTSTSASTGPLVRSVEGHPDLVLARAVADGTLTPHEAELIGATRLDGQSLTRLAADRGRAYEALKKTRARAERRLARDLTASDTPPSASRVRSQPVVGTGRSDPLPGRSR